jgi:hypothetical protein
LRLRQAFLSIGGDYDFELMGRQSVRDEALMRARVFDQENRGHRSSLLSDGRNRNILTLTEEAPAD